MIGKLSDIPEKGSANRILSFALVSMLIMSTFITMGCTEEEKESLGPKDVFADFVKDVEDEKGSAALKSFASSKVDNVTIDEQKHRMEKDIDDGNYSIKRYKIKEIIFKENMTQTMKEDIDDFVKFCEDKIDEEIQSYCKFKVNITQRFKKDAEYRTSEGPFTLIKIGESWYLSDILYSFYLYQNMP